MFALERHQGIVDTARATGRADVMTLSKQFAVAPETIRRDLKDLERQGLLRRVHGGAIPMERLAFESNLSMRSARMQAEKIRIAVAAVGRLHSAEAIYIDEGGLPRLVADRLFSTRPLMVVTPSLPIALSLAGRPQIEVTVLGGRVRPQTGGVADPWAVESLATLVLDLAIMGSNGVSIEHGATVGDRHIAAVKAAAFKAARRRILIADSSKFGNDSFVSFAPLRGFECVITDDGLDRALAGKTRALGIELACV